MSEKISDLTRRNFFAAGSAAQPPVVLKSHYIKNDYVSSNEQRNCRSINPS